MGFDLQLIRCIVTCTLIMWNVTCKLIRCIVMSELKYIVKFALVRCSMTCKLV